MPALDVALAPYGSIRTSRRGQAEHPNYTVGVDRQKAKTGGRISIPGCAKPEQPIAVGLSGLYRVVSFRSAAPGYLFSQFGTDPCRQSTPSTSWPAHENQASIFSLHCDGSLPDRRRGLVFRWAKGSFRILRHGHSSSRGALESVQGWADRPLTLCSRAVDGDH